MTTFAAKPEKFQTITADFIRLNSYAVDSRFQNCHAPGPFWHAAERNVNKVTTLHLPLGGLSSAPQQLAATLWTRFHKRQSTSESVTSPRVRKAEIWLEQADPSLMISYSSLVYSHNFSGDAEQVTTHVWSRPATPCPSLSLYMIFAPLFTTWESENGFCRVKGWARWWEKLTMNKHNTLDQKHAL